MDNIETWSAFYGDTFISLGHHRTYSATSSRELITENSEEANV
jgi:hypothetical protein